MRARKGTHPGRLTNPASSRLHATDSRSLQRHRSDFALGLEPRSGDGARIVSPERAPAGPPRRDPRIPILGRALGRLVARDSG